MGKKPWHFLIAAVVAIGAAARVANATDFHDVKDGFTVSVPDDWQQIPPDAIQTFAGRINPDGKPEVVEIKTGYQQKKTDTEWFSYPFILIGYMPYSSNAQPNEYEISQFIQEIMGVNMEEVIKSKHNQTLSHNLLSGSLDSADWDYGRHAAHILFHGNVATWGLVKGYSCFIFGHKGAIRITYSDTDDRFDAELPMFHRISDSLRFDPGFAYDTNTFQPAAPTPAFDTTDLANSIEACSLVVLVGSVIGITALVTRLNRKREQARLGPIPAEPLESPPLPRLPPLPPR